MTLTNEILETSILQSIITNEDYFGNVFDVLDTTHFSTAENVLIFKEIKELVGKTGERPTTKEVAMSIKGNRKIPEKIKSQVISGVKNLHLDSKIKNIDNFIDMTEGYIKDKEIEIAIHKSLDILESNGDRLSIQNLFEKALSITIDNDVGTNYNKDFDDRMEKYRARAMGITTGLASADAISGGFIDKTLSVYCGSAHSGKSIFKETKLNLYVNIDLSKKILEYMEKKNNT